MNSKTTLLAIIALSTLIITGCGSSTDTTDYTDTTDTNTQVEKTIEKSADGTVEVLEVTSSNIKYDGDHGIIFAAISRHPDYLTIQITLDQDNIITAVQDTHEYGHAKSRQYQTNFQNALAGEVVGKSLDEVSNLRKIGGASTTTEARNAAVEDIQEQLETANG